jgi:arylsulfatase A-like enzyme/Flp pilus assembly protein TadD
VGARRRSVGRAQRLLRTPAVLLLAVVTPVALTSCNTVSPHPNILLVTLDTTRADRLGCYGDRDALTPRLDGLARTGMRFDAAYTPSPMTLPAHATLLTGLEPPEHGLRINGRQRLPDGIPTVAAALGSRGYRTGAFVAAFVLAKRFGLDRGFETYDDDLSGALPQTVHEQLSVYRPGDAVAAAALAWIGSMRRGPSPFFAWVHFYDPHFPHYAHASLARTRFAGVASYDAEIAFMDQQVGRLLDAVDPDTIVIAVADHGEGLGEHGDQEHGYLLNEEVLHIPLLLRWPGKTRPGTSSAALVTSADVAPTILDAAGIPPRESLPGHSLRTSPVPSPGAYAETDLPLWTFGWSPLRSLTTERWKYVRTTRPELYDRASDRTERHDVSASHPDVIAALDRQLTEIESAFRANAAPSVALDPDAHRRLETLGYVAASAPPDAAAADQPRRDIKDMLAVKQLASDVTAGLATGRLDRARAIELTRELVRQSPESAAFQLRLGTLLLQDGDLSAALPPLTEAVRLRPDDAEGRTNLGQALLRAGQLERALPELRAAVALAPDLAEAHLGLGSALAASGHLDEAADRLRDAARLAPTSADAQMNLGNVLLRQGREREAEACYREALRLRPDAALAHLNLGTLLARGDSTDEATSEAREAVRLAPELAPAHHLLGRLRIEDGATTEAIAQYRIATQLDPTVPEFFDDLAAAYAADGQTGAAIATARRAMAKARKLGRDDLARDIVQRIAFYRSRAGSAAPRDAR